MNATIEAMATRLMSVRGVRAVALGGSRARGTHRPDSDWDLGVYYRGEPDVAALAALAAEVTGSPVEVAGPGGWGPWVNGGAWLSVDGVAVDWILRDLDRVERVWAECREGRFEIGTQPGHPLGFWSPAYAGEVALCRVLADAEGELTALRAAARRYPEPLRTALTGAVWEADFSVAAARKAAGSGGTRTGAEARARATRCTCRCACPGPSGSSYRPSSPTTGSGASTRRARSRQPPRCRTRRRTSRTGSRRRSGRWTRRRWRRRARWYGTYARCWTATPDGVRARPGRDGVPARPATYRR